MNCERAQQLLDDLARQRLPAELVAVVTQHLADCTDCRVLHQRSLRLQRLLALKRYEQPPPGYFRGVVAEFHGRLAAAADGPRWWERLSAANWLDAGSALSSPLRTAGLTAAAACLMLAVYFYNSQPGGNDTTATLPMVVIPTNVATLAPSPANPAAPAGLAPGGPVLTTAGSRSRTGSGLVVDLTPATAEPAAPRYILDSIAITPASYDVPSANF